jgi:hypothetical protein
LYGIFTEVARKDKKISSAALAALYFNSCLGLPTSFILDVAVVDVFEEIQ